MNNFFKQIECVNLDRRGDKWEECLAEFATHGLKVDRFSAVDGNPIGYKGGLLDGAIGNLLSHIDIIKRAKENGYDNVLIFEDDIIMLDGVVDIFNEWVKGVPDDWDLLYLGGNHNDSLNIMVNEHVKKITNTYTTHAYAIRNTVYDLVLDTLNKFSSEGDVLMAEVQRECNAYCFIPNIAWQRPSKSDIFNKYVNYDFLTPKGVVSERKYINVRVKLNTSFIGAGILTQLMFLIAHVPCDKYIKNLYIEVPSVGDANKYKGREQTPTPDHHISESDNPLDWVIDQSYEDDYEVINASSENGVYYKVEEHYKLPQLKNIVKRLKIKKNVLDVVNDFCDNNITKKTLGVHLRVTDMNTTHPQHGTFTTNDFVEMIRDILGKEDIDTIFVSSDNDESIGILKNEFPNVVFRECGTREDTEVIDFAPNTINQLQQDNPYLWEDTFIDMLILSRCPIILCRVSGFANMSILFSSIKQKIYRMPQYPIKINATWFDGVYEYWVMKKIPITVDVDRFNDSPVPEGEVRILVLFEPYDKLIQTVIDNPGRYTYIFTYRDEILNSNLNAIFFIAVTMFIRDETVLDKTFSVSTVVGGKNNEAYLGYKLRHELWFKRNKITIPKDFYLSGTKHLKSNLIKTRRGIINAENHKQLGDEKHPLFNSMFHIAIENVSINNFFTEKITDCFMTRTVPIYIGARNIGEFFNLDGIICSRSINETIEICNTLTEDDYYSMMPAMEDNLKRAYKYKGFDELLLNKINELI